MTRRPVIITGEHKRPEGGCFNTVGKRVGPHLVGKLMRPHKEGDY